MTRLRAKRILSRMFEYGTFDVDRLETLPPCYVSLTPKGGQISCRVDLDMLRAIALWMEDPEAVVDA